MMRGWLDGEWVDAGYSMLDARYNSRDWHEEFAGLNSDTRLKLKS
jgi:hypothetical protein